MNYHLLNQFVTPVVAAVPGAVSWLKQMNTSAGPWRTASGLAKAFSPSLGIRSSRILLLWGSKANDIP